MLLTDSSRIYERTEELLVGWAPFSTFTVRLGFFFFVCSGFFIV